MRMDRFTTLAQEAISTAQSRAMGMSHAELTPMHLLAALIEDQSGLGRSLLEKTGANADQILQITGSELSRLPTVSNPQANPSRALVELLARAEKEARD